MSTEQQKNRTVELESRTVELEKTSLTPLSSLKYKKDATLSHPQPPNVIDSGTVRLVKSTVDKPF